MDAHPGLRLGIPLIPHGFPGVFRARNLGRDIAEPVAADPRTGLRDEAITDDGPGADADHFAQRGVVAQRRIHTDDAMRADHRALTNHRPRAHNGERTDRGALANLGSRVDHGGRVNARCDPLPPVQHRGDSRHRHARTSDKDRGLKAQSLPIRAFPQHSRAGGPGGQRLGIFR